MRPFEQQELRNRIARLTRWVRQHGQDCEHEQKHLDEGSRERAYWHCGYLVALRDVLSLMTRRSKNLPIDQ
jgi:hypothetical protein